MVFTSRRRSTSPRSPRLGWCKRDSQSEKAAADFCGGVSLYAKQKQRASAGAECRSIRLPLPPSQKLRRASRTSLARCRSCALLLCAHTPMSQPQLIARDLFQSFQMGPRRIEVLRGISMEINYGEAVFLCGASGAGKTTLLYTLGGLERPESSTVEFEGQSLYSRSSAAQARIRNRKMGFVFQGYFLLPELSALENVSLPGKIRAAPSRQNAEETLRAVGLGERMHHLPAELSGGEQQRVAIARALSNDPDIIFR